MTEQNQEQIAMQTKVICLPFAGGNKYSLKRPISNFLSDLDFCFIEYPGRGTRSGEGLIQDFDKLIDDVVGQLTSVIGNQEEFIIYGHSMGGLIGFEIIDRLSALGYKRPQLLVISSTTGPSAKGRTLKEWHNFPKDLFIEKLMQLDGCPREIFDNAELMEYLEPIIRADFKAISTYKYKDRGPLPVPILVFYGDEEPLPQEEIQLWQKESVHEVEFVRMQGKHFFIFNSIHKILEAMINKLTRHR